MEKLPRYAISRWKVYDFCLNLTDVHVCTVLGDIRRIVGLRTHLHWTHGEIELRSRALDLPARLPACMVASSSGAASAENRRGME